MSEFIRVNVNDQDADEKSVTSLVKDIFMLDQYLILDVVPVFRENQLDIEISSGARAVVVGKLGQLQSISISESKED